MNLQSLAVDDKISYHLSIARVPSLQERPEEPTCWHGCADTILRTLAILVDPQFFKVCSFYFIAIAMAANNIGMMLPSIFLIGKCFLINFKIAVNSKWPLVQNIDR